MIILHGIYDHGKVEIKEHKKPDIRKEVRILLDDDNNKRKSVEGIREFFNQYQVDLTSFRFNRDEANER